MTREEFMDIVYSELHSDGDNYRANRIIDAADEYAEEKTKWIPTKPRLIFGKNGKPEYIYDGKLPNDQEDIMIITKLGFIDKVRFYNNYTDTFFTGYDGEYKGDVEAWMPLPQPYQPKEEKL